ncbi:hypothetical protein RJ53_03425 [Methanocalculus chunghsingensis]|uniref:Uncharacterized protein n=1 Tax=Methanocalculus chunghsingensis TaxID=156457 RepID=A0A8J7W6T3_9EURY|nr:HEAT repeat domain-containing protein [Methanocalculus chunghsingensis]MBR1368603.1 hypothetical protein [Methanocalculus chunghsingensis]
MGLFDIFRPNIEKLKERGDVDGLIRACESPDSQIRENSVSALMSLMPGALPGVIAAAVDQDEKRRSCAALVLNRIESPAIPHLMRILIKEDGRKREYAAAALASIGTPAAAPLIECLHHIEEEKSELIIATLVHIGSNNAPFLREGLFSPSYRSRRGAAQALDAIRISPESESEAAARLIALGQWKDLQRFRRAAVPILIRLLDDDYYVSRVNAARTLGNLGDSEAIAPLLGILSDKDGNVRTAAAEALGAIGDVRAIPRLVTALEDEYYSVRMEAASSLDRLGWYPANDTGRARYFIATEQWEKVAAIGRAAVPPLIDTLRDDYYSVRKGISESLRSLARYSIGPLEEALSSPDIRIRNGAGELLTSLGKSDRVFRPLRPGNRDEEGDTKQEKSRGAGSIDLSKKNRSPDEKIQLKRMDQGTGEERRAVSEEKPEEKPDKGEDNDETERVALFPEKKFVKIQRVIQKIDPAVHEKLAGIGSATPEKIDEQAEPLINALLRVLSEGDEESRLIALDALLTIGPPALPVLIGALSDTSPPVRAAAAEMIGEIGEPSAARYLLPLLADGEGAVRAMAARSLGKLRSTDAISPLITCLPDLKADVKREAVIALGRIGRPAVENLVATLNGPSDEIRRGAAEALGEIGDQRAIPHLVNLLGSDNAGVRAAAIEALKRFDVAVIRPLEEILAAGSREEKLAALLILADIGENARYLIEHASADPDPVISEKAEILLGGGDIGRVDDRGINRSSKQSDVESAKDIIPLIQDLLSGNKEAQIQSAQELVLRGAAAVSPLIEILLKGNREQRATAAEILAEIRGPAVEELLTLLRDGGRDTRITVALLLGKIGDPQTIDPLIRMLTDRDYRIRIAAAESLGISMDPRAVSALTGLLTDDDPDVVVAAIRAIGYIGDPTAVAPLIQKLGDEDFSVRSASAEALAGMEDAAIQSLVSALSDPVKDVRSGAADALKEIGWTPGDGEARAQFLFAQGRWNEMSAEGSVAVPILIDALADPDEDIRMGAARALGRTGDPTAIPPLIKGLSDEYTLIRKVCADALFEMGEEALPALKDESATADPMGRKMIQGVCDRILRRGNQQ